MNRAIFEAEQSLEHYPEAPAGSWEDMTCPEYEIWLNEADSCIDRCVWSSLGDMEGEFGEPLRFTLWGTRTTPTVASLLLYDGQKPAECYHARFVEATDA